MESVWPIRHFPFGVEDGLKRRWAGREVGAVTEPKLQNWTDSSGKFAGIILG